MCSFIYKVYSLDRVNTRSWKITKSPYFKFETLQAARDFVKSYKFNYSYLYDDSNNEKVFFLYIEKHTISKPYNSLLETFVYNSSGTELIYSDGNINNSNISFKRGDKVNVLFGDELLAGLILKEPDPSMTDNLNKEYYEVLFLRNMQKNYCEKCFVYSPNYKRVDIDNVKINEILSGYNLKKTD